MTSAADISTLEQRFRSDVVREANALPQLTALLGHEDDESAFLAVRAITRCMGTAVSNSELYRAAVLEAGDRAQFALTQADPAAVGRLLEWAHTQYAKAGAQLATLAGHREGGVAIPAIGALAELMGLLHSAAAPHSIPLQTDWITRAVNALVSGNEPLEAVLASFAQAFGSFADVRAAAYSALAEAVEAKEKGQDAVATAALGQRVFGVAAVLGPPSREAGTLRPESTGAKKLFSRQKKAFSRLWAALLRCPLTASLYKAILSVFPADVLPFLSHPVMTVDFCLAAYRQGGYCALLSLKSLFVIATTVNIEVPEFYPKLYALLSPSLFVSKRRGELFELADLFLSSEYLPLGVAAAFAKKLARLALGAPAPGAVVCMQLVFNILRRHPNTLFLIHRAEEGGEQPRRKWRRAEAVDRRKEVRKEEGEEKEEKDDYVAERALAEQQEDIERPVEAELALLEEEEDAPPARRPAVPAAATLDSDPFDDSASDPAEAHAQDSQLWELLALQRHAIPAVAEAAALFSGSLERPLFVVATAASLSSRDLLDKLRRKRARAVPLEHRAKPSLLDESVKSLYFP